MKKVVSKFGGSSMRDAKAMLRSAGVANKQKSNIILVSATYKSTDKLVALISASEKSNSEDCEKILFEIEEKHLAILKELGIYENTEDKLNLLFDELRTLSKGISLLKDCSEKTYDSVLSIGERMSSLLFVVAMNKTLRDDTPIYFDIRNVLKTDSKFNKATPQLSLIKELCAKAFDFSKHIYISQGFIGQDANGSTTTLGRGGSDYSASLIAEAIDADILEIWTDVAGIATTDPRICKNAKQIKEITFQEASELATYGAKVLHPTTLAPAMRKSIPVFVGSSFDQEASGTWIIAESNQLPTVRAITKRDGQALLTIKTPKMLNAIGFMSKIFDIFNQHQISVDSVTTSEISVAITIEQTTFDNKHFLFELGQIGHVTLEKNLSLVSLIGNRIQQTSGLGEKLFKALDDINVRMICLGASAHNFCFVVEGDKSSEAVKRLHKFFIETQESEQ
jgi:aspartate kinase